MLMGMIFGAIAAGGYGDENDGIFTRKVGNFEVFMLVESQRDGNAGILVGADEATLSRYIPAGRFQTYGKRLFNQGVGKKYIDRYRNGSRRYYCR